MADLSPAPDSHNRTNETDALKRRKRHRSRRWVALGIVLVKLAIIALIVVLPSALAISLVAIHGVALLILLVAAAVVLVVFKLRGRTLRPALSHLPFDGHGLVPAWGSARGSQEVEERGKQMSILEVPGARLYYETHGSGPLMIMIPGASGVADSFRMVAEHLAARYTVLIYDRRGFSRSQLNGPQDYDHRLETDADDVRRLIEHISDEPAAVFGASSGAVVALAVLTHYPSVVRTLIPFEPPVMRQLPDGQKWVDFFTGLYDLYRQSGIELALTRFRKRTFPASDLQIMAHAPKNDANAAYWFEHELRQYPRAELDLDALKARADRIVLAAGRDGGGYPAHDATAALGKKLGRGVIELPGGHVGFLADPVQFARELVHALGRTGTPTPAIREAYRADSVHCPGSMSQTEWEDSYARSPHWDIGRPQPALRALADAGAIQGRVLDVGCGTGEHVLMAAALGLDATGVDFASAPLHTAESKARERGLTARFLLRDARKLADLGKSFDTVLDCGLFHIFGDEDRADFVASVRSVLRPGGRYFVLCFSDQQPGDRGPRRVTQDEITTSFAEGWRIDSIEPATIDSPTDPDGVQAWLVTLTRI